MGICSRTFYPACSLIAKLSRGLSSLPAEVYVSTDFQIFGILLSLRCTMQQIGLFKSLFKLVLLKISFITNFFVTNFLYFKSLCFQKFVPASTGHIVNMFCSKL